MSGSTDLDTKTKASVTTSPLEEKAIDISPSGNTVVADTVEQISTSLGR